MRELTTDRRQAEQRVRAEKVQSVAPIVQDPVPVGQLAGRQARPERPVAPWGVAGKPGIGTLLDEVGEERQASLLSQGQEDVEGCSAEADAPQGGSRCALDLGRPRGGDRERFERLSALDHDVDRRDHQQAHQNPTADPVAATGHRMQESRVEADESRGGEADRRLDESRVDARRHVVGKVGGVEPVDQGT